MLQTTPLSPTVKHIGTTRPLLKPAGLPRGGVAGPGELINERAAMPAYDGVVAQAATSSYACRGWGVVEEAPGRWG